MSMTCCKVSPQFRITGKIKEFCKEGRSNLTKFSSNSSVVPKTIQDKNRKDAVKYRDQAIDVLA